MRDSANDSAKGESELSIASADARRVLREVFGFSDFRGDQEAVITRTLLAQNSVLLMPTGFGKSLCYQIPARILAERKQGLTLVISPLIALMKDQVDAAVKKGLRAAFINSSLSSEERERRYRKLAAGEYELLYVTPERFRIEAFRSSLQHNRIALLAVDEAHCISSWGHDFRPDYSRLGDIRRELGGPTTLALTATATREVQSDILTQLGLDSADTVIFNRGVVRENLALQVLNVHGIDEKVRALIAFRHAVQGPAIVYFSLIQNLRKFEDAIRRLGVQPLVYHGQLDDRARRRSQEQFLGSSDVVMFATPAFGLGVDKDNVRMVMHAEIPGSLEAYYQEVGRAGRDGVRADCILLYDEDDVTIQNDFLNWANPDPGFIRAVYNLIARNTMRANQQGFDYLREQMNFYNRRDFRVETAVNQLERWGSLEGRKPSEWRAVSDPPDEYLDAQKFDLRMRAQRRKLFELTEFAGARDGCRMTAISTYFGWPGVEPCGLCDLCQAAK